MRITRTEFLINRGPFAGSPDFQQLIEDIHTGISRVTWPVDSENFCINPVRHGNGVKYIKTNCMQYLFSAGWKLEFPSNIATRIKPGRIDAVRILNNNMQFACEWETGNISSSHRAISKMAVGLLEKQLVGGVLLLPSRTLYTYLTDRIGNFKEIEPYFPIYRNLMINEGVLAVIEFEHDAVSDTVPLLPKGTDGRALK